VCLREGLEGLIERTPQQEGEARSCEEGVGGRWADQLELEGGAVRRWPEQEGRATGWWSEQEEGGTLLHSHEGLK
jgi:hypothetical protein